MKYPRAFARLLVAARRPSRRAPWLRLVYFEADPKPKPAAPTPAPGPKPAPSDTTFDESWDRFPALRDSVWAWSRRQVIAKPDFEKLTDAVKARSFTAARVASDAGLTDTLRSLQSAMTEGLTVREWREKHWDRIQAKFGKPGGTAPWYTLTVFRTNSQAGLAAGRYAELFSDEAVELQPWVRYSAILDARVRPEHRALHGKVFLKTDPFARSYFPPLGFNCRCHLEAVPFGETPRKVTPGARIPDLKRPGGGRVGPPPKGWDTDRVDALLQAFRLKGVKSLPAPAPAPVLKFTPPVTRADVDRVWGEGIGELNLDGSLTFRGYYLDPDGPDLTLSPAKVRQAVAAAPARAQKGPKFGEPGWQAPNGLTVELVDEAYAWNPKIAKATLNPDGSVTLKYKTAGGTTKLSPEKAPGAVQKAAAKKGAPPPAPKPAKAAPPAPAPAQAPPATPAPPATAAVPDVGAWTQADLDAVAAFVQANPPPTGPVTWKTAHIRPDGSLALYDKGGKLYFDLPAGDDTDSWIAALKMKMGKPATPSAPAVPAPAPKDPLYSLTKTITDHLPKPEDYDPTWAVSGPSKSRSFGAVIFDEQGRVLIREPLGHYDGYAWTFPKGKPNGGESALAAALREVEEETGVSFEALSTVKGTHASGYSNNNYFLGRAKSSTGVLDSETSRIRWVGVDEAEELIKQTTNVGGQKRDLGVLKAAIERYQELTGKTPPVGLPKKPKTAPSGPTAVALKPPPPVVSSKPIPTGPHVLPTFEGFPAETDLGKLREVRKLGGSTGAVLVEDSQGRRFVMKKGASPDHLREEVFADAAYHAAGVKVPEFRLYETAGGPVKLSKFIQGESLADVVRKGGKRADEVLDRLRKDFAADALLGNWDVVGSGMDNVLVDAGGIPWRIDNGGSLRFRAMGARKLSNEWNEWPTELWTGRGINRAPNDATKLFATTGWRSITDRSEGLVGSREAILRALPEDVRKTVAGRLEVMERLNRNSRMMFDDDFGELHADNVSRHRVGMGQRGVLNELPRELKQSGSGAKDELGRAWGGLRTQDGAARSFYDYVDSLVATKTGPRRGSNLLRDYQEAQAGSSQSQTSRAVKDWIVRKRGRPLDEYAGVVPKSELRDPKRGIEGQLSRFLSSSGLTEAEFDEVMTAQHAFTMELLSRVQTVDNDVAGLTVRVRRAEGKRHHAGKAVGWEGTYDANPLESTTHGPGADFGYDKTRFEFTVPHHRVFLTFWQYRPGRYHQDCLLGESEFLAMLTGLRARVYRVG